MFKIISILITLFFLALGILLGVLNPGEVSFDLVFQVIHIPLSILLSLAFTLGMLLAAVYFVSLLVQKKWQIRKLTKANAKLSDEVVQLNKKQVELESKQENVVSTELATVTEK